MLFVVCWFCLFFFAFLRSLVFVFLRACWKVEVWKVKVKVRQVCFCLLFVFTFLSFSSSHSLVFLQYADSSGYTFAECFATKYGSQVLEATHLRNEITDWSVGPSVLDRAQRSDGWWSYVAWKDDGSVVLGTDIVVFICFVP